jgi:hypothetical protein
MGDHSDRHLAANSLKNNILEGSKDPKDLFPGNSGQWRYVNLQDRIARESRIRRAVEGPKRARQERKRQDPKLQDDRASGRKARTSS